MNKIRFAANKDTNYVFHMLSTAKCGYDNEYSKKYCDIYPPEDLSVIKRNEDLLTVCGGQHCGVLFGLMVSQPACAYVSAKEYYNGIIQLGNEILNGNIPDNIEKSYIPYTEIIIEISEIMVKHYDYYTENIWKHEKEKIEQYIPKLFDLFENSLFTEKAENLIGSLKSDYFTATLVTSVAGGAEAIDISDDQDVFGIERTYTDAFYFIGHEFIIYLLMKILSHVNAFNSFETWDLTEGLAEYYLKKIMGDTRFFNEQKKYVKFYDELSNHRSLSASELYKAALEQFIYNTNLNLKVDKRNSHF